MWDVFTAVRTRLARHPKNAGELTTLTYELLLVMYLLGVPTRTVEERSGVMNGWPEGPPDAAVTALPSTEREMVSLPQLRMIECHSQSPTYVP